MLKVGDIAVVKTTRERVMVLDVIECTDKSKPPVYEVRTSSYKRGVQLYAFELKEVPADVE
jgi:hypothetical protein